MTEPVCGWVSCLKALAEPLRRPVCGLRRCQRRSAEFRICTWARKVVGFVKYDMAVAVRRLATISRYAGVCEGDWEEAFSVIATTNHVEIRMC